MTTASAPDSPSTVSRPARSSSTSFFTNGATRRCPRSRQTRTTRAAGVISSPSPTVKPSRASLASVAARERLVVLVTKRSVRPPARNRCTAATAPGTGSSSTYRTPSMSSRSARGLVLSMVMRAASRALWEDRPDRRLATDAGGRPARDQASRREGSLRRNGVGGHDARTWRGKVHRFVLFVPAHAVVAMAVVAEDFENQSASRMPFARRLLDPVAGAARIRVARLRHRPPSPRAASSSSRRSAEAIRSRVRSTTSMLTEMQSIPAATSRSAYSG